MLVDSEYLARDKPDTARGFVAENITASFLAKYLDQQADQTADGGSTPTTFIKYHKTNSPAQQPTPSDPPQILETSLLVRDCGARYNYAI